MCAAVANPWSFWYFHPTWDKVHKTHSILCWLRVPILSFHSFSQGQSEPIATQAAAGIPLNSPACLIVWLPWQPAPGFETTSTCWSGATVHLCSTVLRRRWPPAEQMKPLTRGYEGAYVHAHAYMLMVLNWKSEMDEKNRSTSVLLFCFSVCVCVLGMCIDHAYIKRYAWSIQEAPIVIYSKVFNIKGRARDRLDT
jgi:hypothetical protein